MQLGHIPDSEILEFGGAFPLYVKIRESDTEEPLILIVHRLCLRLLEAARMPPKPQEKTCVLRVNNLYACDFFVADETKGTRYVRYMGDNDGLHVFDIISPDGLKGDPLRQFLNHLRGYVPPEELETYKVVPVTLSFPATQGDRDLFEAAARVGKMELEEWMLDALRNAVYMVSAGRAGDLDAFAYGDRQGGSE